MKINIYWATEPSYLDNRALMNLWLTCVTFAYFNYVLVTNPFTILTAVALLLMDTMTLFFAIAFLISVKIK